VQNRRCRELHGKIVHLAAEQSQLMNVELTRRGGLLTHLSVVLETAMKSSRAYSYGHQAPVRNCPKGTGVLFLAKTADTMDGVDDYTC
jgi:hypothetical protein